MMIVMTMNSTTVENDEEERCYKLMSVVPAILLSTFILFGHGALAVIMYKRGLYRYPQGRILASLALSDLMITLTSYTILTSGLLLHASSKECTVLRDCMSFMLPFLVLSTSFNILALAIERYVHCVHSLLYYAYIFDRVNWILGLVWIFSFVGSGLPLICIRTNYASYRISSTSVTTGCIFLTSAVLLVTQVRLYLLAKSKINAEMRVTAGIGDVKIKRFMYRRKRMKLAATASVLAIFYVICFVPYAITRILQLRMCSGACATAKSVFGNMAIINALLNPIIYGMTISEVRQFFKMCRNRNSVVPLTNSSFEYSRDIVRAFGGQETVLTTVG